MVSFLTLIFSRVIDFKVDLVFALQMKLCLYLDPFFMQT